MLKILLLAGIVFLLVLVVAWFWNKNEADQFQDVSNAGTPHNSILGSEQKEAANPLEGIALRPQPIYVKCSWKVLNESYALKKKSAFTKLSSLNFEDEEINFEKLSSFCQNLSHEETIIRARFLERLAIQDIYSDEMSDDRRNALLVFFGKAVAQLEDSDVYVIRDGILETLEVAPINLSRAFAYLELAERAIPLCDPENPVTLKMKLLVSDELKPLIIQRLRMVKDNGKAEKIRAIIKRMKYLEFLSAFDGS